MVIFKHNDIFCFLYVTYKSIVLSISFDEEMLILSFPALNKVYKSSTSTIIDYTYWLSDLNFVTKLPDFFSI